MGTERGGALAGLQQQMWPGAGLVGGWWGVEGQAVPGSEALRRGRPGRGVGTGLEPRGCCLQMAS